MKKILLFASAVLGSHVAAAKPARKIVVISHRSASGYLPEHTLPAVALAHGFGPDYIEPDVVLTKDGVPIVLHDIHLEKTTNVEQAFPGRRRADGRWYAIDFTLAEVKTLRVHERLPNRFPQSSDFFSVPTLEEEILLIQGLNKTRGKAIGIYPEIKSPAFHRQEGQDIAKVTLALLAKHGYDKKDSPVYFQCFDPKELRRVREELKSPLKLVQLIGENSWKESDADYDKMRTEEGIKEVATYADGIGPSLGHVLTMDPKTKKPKATPLVGWAHARKMTVHPYTVRADDLPPGVPSVEALYKALVDVAEVDGFFTDFTDSAVAYINH